MGNAFRIEENSDRCLDRRRRLFCAPSSHMRALSSIHRKTLEQSKSLPYIFFYHFSRLASCFA